MISIIVAIDKNNLIDKNNKLPWYYPEDLKYFKDTTINKTVAMGYNTYKSIIDKIKKPLPKTSPPSDSSLKIESRLPGLNWARKN